MCSLAVGAQRVVVAGCRRGVSVNEKGRMSRGEEGGKGETSERVLSVGTSMSSWVWEVKIHASE